MMGISDKTFNTNIRKILHQYSKRLVKSNFFPFVYCFEGGYKSVKIGSSYLDQIEHEMNIPKGDKLYPSYFLPSTMHMILYGLALTHHAII